LKGVKRKEQVEKREGESVNKPTLLFCFGEVVAGFLLGQNCIPVPVFLQ
jgi:hypothetical protein